MAASVREMVGVCEDSSSSDDEALRRCREAVWETRGDTNTDGVTSVQQSKRFVVAKHEHDGNELQVTEGFRTHVAKKLGTLLDSCISETRTETSSCVESANQDDNDDDEGFRLFSTSVPGQTAEEPPAAVRRRPAPSSSDSDSEMETRLKEAAVSVKDLLPSFSSTPAEEPPCSETPKKKKKKKKKKEAEAEEEAEEEEEESCVVKKKKKRKQTRGESDSAASPLQQNGSSEPERVKVKRKKKKKKREGNTEEETLD